MYPSIHVPNGGGLVEFGRHFPHGTDSAPGEECEAWQQVGDGGGLRLDVDRNGNRSWVFRFTSPVTGSERFMGLGPARDVTLSQARDAAVEARALIRERKDPIEHRKEQRTAAKVEASKAVTFKAYAEQFTSGREAGWKNPRRRDRTGTGYRAAASRRRRPPGVRGVSSCRCARGGWFPFGWLHNH